MGISTSPPAKRPRLADTDTSSPAKRPRLADTDTPQAEDFVSVLKTATAGSMEKAHSMRRVGQANTPKRTELQRKCRGVCVICRDRDCIYAPYHGESGNGSDEGLQCWCGRCYGPIEPDPWDGECRGEDAELHQNEKHEHRRHQSVGSAKEDGTDSK